MVFNQNKAQGTIEYLVIIAVVVVIALVVVALVLNMSDSDSTQINSNKNQNLIGKGGISIIDSIMSSTGDGVISLQNTLGENLTIKTIIPGAENNCEKILSPGEKYDCYLTDINSACPCSVGQRVTCEFRITFESKNGLEKSEKFTIINDCTGPIPLKEDTTSPTITLLTPVIDSVIDSADNNVNFTFRANETTTDCNLYIDNDLAERKTQTVNANVTNTIDANLALFNEGDHEWKVSCKDNAGNVGISTDQNINYTQEITEAVEHTLTINISPSNSGTTSVGGDYEENENIQITAVPNQGYAFINWTTNNGGTFEDDENSTTIFTMPNADVTITANIEEIVIEIIPNTTINSIVYDEEGNALLSGSFTGTINLGDTTLTSTGGTDVFIAKLSPTGEWLWAEQAGGTGNDTSNSINIDSSGNIILMGSYISSADFGIINVEDESNYAWWDKGDLFIAKISSSGDWQWANTGQIQHEARLLSGNNPIYIDPSGNAFVTGQFCGGAEFGSYTLDSQVTNLYDIFVAKISSSGDWQWATQSTINSNGYDLTLNEIKYDQSGNAFLTGSFCGGVSFADQDLYTSNAIYANNNKDIFVAKISSSGDWQWAKQAGGNYYETANTMEFDDNDDLILVGQFRTSSTIGETTLTASGLTDAYVAKISSSGDWQWAKQAGGTLTDNATLISTDTSGNAFITGQFCGTATIDDTTLIADNFYPNIFITKISSNGDWQWAKQAGGTLTNIARSIITDSSGNIFIAGQFSGDNSTFGETTLVGYPTVYVDTPPSSGGPGGLVPQPNANIFVAKISSSGDWQWAKQAGGSLTDNATKLIIQNNKLNIIGTTISNPNYFNDGNFSTTGTFIWEVNPSDGSN